MISINIPSLGFQLLRLKRNFLLQNVFTIKSLFKLTSSSFCFWVVPWLNACSTEYNKRQISEEVNAGRDEEDYAPLKWIRLRNEK